MENMEMVSFQLILHSGNARSSSYEALDQVKQDHWEAGEKKIKEARAELIIAQKQHAQLLRKMANEEAVAMDLLLVHAEDHIASSQVVVELIDEMIQIYERFGERI